MNTTGKLIFALVISANLAAIAAVGAINLHRRATQESQVIHLGTIVVTPADAETPVIELGTVVVTPTEADWRFAEAHGVYRRQEVATNVGKADDDAGQRPEAALLQALAALSPGKYLVTNTALRALNTLVFDGQGR